MHWPLSYWWLLPIGLLLGMLGTVLGAGGGFLLVPVLLLLYPEERPETITAISLAVVFVNALSGSLAYARMRRVDYKSGLLLAAATIPGAILGALATSFVPRRLFDFIFGVLLVALAAFLFASKLKTARSPQTRGDYRAQRAMIDRDGTTHTYSYDLRVGTGLSVLVGFFSSLLGIGGGIIHVPALVYLLNFPPHIATATSHFILTFMALAGTSVHVAQGAFIHGTRRAIVLAVGATVGAQLGARLSDRVKGPWIIGGLAVGLAFVGMRILVEAS